MKLADLGPRFIRYEKKFEGHRGIKPPGGEFGSPYHFVSMPHVEALAEAQGLLFKCPLCFRKNGGPTGTHMVEITFQGRAVPDDVGVHNSAGQPTRWGVHGTGLHDLTISPSILIEGGCGWHGWVTDGKIV